MNTTHHTKTKLLAKAIGVAAAAVMAPALLIAGAGTAHACVFGESPYDAGVNAGRGVEEVPCSYGTTGQSQYDQGVQAGHGLAPFFRPGF